MKSRTVRLGEVVRIEGGGTPSRDRADYFGGSIPWMTVKDFGDELRIRRTQESITASGLDNSASRLIPAGNVIVGTRMSVGRAVVNLVDLAINQDLKALMCDGKLHPEYLNFCLAFLRPKLSAQATGATVKGITIDDIQNLCIPLPSLPEQRLIAAVLERADRLRRTHRRAIDLADTFVPAAFLEMFGDPVKNQKGWPIKTLGEQLNFLTSGSRGWAEFYAVEGDIFIRIQNVGHGELILRDIQHIKAPDNAEAKRTQVQPGDVLLSITADLGRSAWIPLGFPKAYINQHLAILRQDRMNPVFLAAQLGSQSAKRVWDKIDRAAVKSGLNFNDVRGFRIVEPPLPLQRRFASLVAEHERLRAMQREALRQAEHLFQTLLHDAFADGAA